MLIKGVLKRVLYIVVICTLITNVFNVTSIEGIVTIPISIDSVQVIGEYTLPPPYSKYRILLKSRFYLKTTLRSHYSTDKDLIRPGESITLEMKLQKATTHIRLYIIFQLFKEEEQIMIREIPLPEITHSIPSSTETPEIPISIPLHKFGIPITIVLYIRMRITSTVCFILSAEGLHPPEYILEFSENRMNHEVSFTKHTGIGARVILDTVALKFSGKLYVSLGILELPIKYKFPPLPLLAFTTEKIVERELLKLKTPIMISMTASRNEVILGESVLFSGRASPEAEGIEVDLLVRRIGGDWSIVSTMATQPDGSFTIRWTPNQAGEYEIKIYHKGSDYTTEASSSIVSVRVLRPAKFEVTVLSVSPIEVNVGESVTITVSVRNVGDVEGTHTVTLKINGVVEATRSVRLEGGSSTTIVFRVVKTTPGEYSIEVNGWRGYFRVKKAPPPIGPWLQLLSFVIIVIIAIIIIILITKRRPKVPITPKVSKPEASVESLALYCPYHRKKIPPNAIFCP